MSEFAHTSSPDDLHEDPLLQTVNMGKSIAFVPEKELWLSADPKLREVAHNVGAERWEKITEIAHNTIELVRKNDIINHLEKDPLTGLETRAIFERDIKSFVRRNEPGTALVYVDLLGLNRVNDDKEIGGHQKGDEYLVTTVNANLAASRPGDKTYRLSGDELAIILVGLKPDENGSYEKAINAAIKSRKYKVGEALKESDLPAEELYLGISAGGVSIENSAGDIEQIKKQADMKMFEDKREFYASLPQEVQAKLKKDITPK